MATSHHGTNCTTLHAQPTEFLYAAPVDLSALATQIGAPLESEAFAAEMDRRDPLYEFRKQFHFPQLNDQDAIYLCGNSLGLQPKATRGALNEELDNWACALCRFVIGHSGC